MRALSRFVQSLTFACLVCTSTTGCFMVPFVQAFKESGFTAEDRMTLLPPKVKKFSDARVFGNKSDALALVMPEARLEVSKQLREGGEHERIVKSRIEEVEWIDDARKARLIMKVESYRVNQLVVNTTVEEQVWEFSTVDGWMLSSRSKLEG
jgi:hypothetical protein